MYLSSLQVGLQSAHVIGDMFVKYEHTNTKNNHLEKKSMLFDWAEHHKTMILLNGGYSENLYMWIDFLKMEDNNFPWTFFRESEEALDSALTSVGIILPERIYEGAAKLRTFKPHKGGESDLWRNSRKIIFETENTKTTEKFTEWEAVLLEKLNQLSLAQ